MRLIARVLLALMLTGAVSARAGDFYPTLNPKSYRSPSGRVRLVIDPRQMTGRGAADYRLTRDGHLVWSGKRDFTLSEAAVGDDGQVAGYGYSGGEALSRGEFVVAILGSKGAVRLKEVTRQTESMFLHEPDDPVGKGVILDAANDRVIIRLRDADLNRGLESWWLYHLSTARRERVMEPVPPPDVHRPYIRRAFAIPGTPLLLLHWVKFASPGAHSHYRLVDEVT
jgi:hypothetical protein